MCGRPGRRVSTLYPQAFLTTSGSLEAISDRFCDSSVRTVANALLARLSPGQEGRQVWSAGRLVP